MSASVLADVAPGRAIPAGGGYQVIPFSRWHYKAVYESMLAAGWPQLIKDPDEEGAMYERGGPAFSAIFAGRVLGCAGIAVPWPGLGIGWLQIAPEGRQEHSWVVARMLLRRMPALAKGAGLRRLEADVREDFEAGNRLMAWLGFQRESTMPHYGPGGETFCRWVMFPYTSLDVESLRHVPALR